MSKLIKSFSSHEEDAYLDWIDGAESCGEMDTCPGRAPIILKLARQELERLGHGVTETESFVGIELDVLCYGIQVFPGLGVICYARGERGKPETLIYDVYDDSRDSLAEILRRIPPAKAFPYCLIGRSVKIADDTGYFHVNFIGSVPVVSVGGRHSFFEGELVAGGCDDDGDYCHVPVSAIEHLGYEEACNDD